MAPPRRVLLGLATAGLLALAGWAIAALWGPAGLPYPAFQPGLTGHPPDPRAWPRLFAWALPALFGASSLLQLWLDPGPGGRRARRLDAWTYVGLPAFLLLELGAARLGHWQGWLGGAYIGLVAVKVGLLVSTASRLAAPDVDLPPAPAGGRGLDPRVARLARAVLAISALAYVATSAYVITAVSTTGDEPYYLLVAHSLVRDGDLDLANQFERLDYRPFYWGPLFSGQNMVRLETGRLYSVTYSGLLAVLLAPGYRLAGRLGATVTVSLLTALLVQQLFLLAWETTGRRRAAFLTWGLVAFTSPVLFFATQLYPEVPAALAVTIAVRVIRGLPPRGGPPVGQVIGLGLALVALPLLKLRLAVLAGGLAVWTLVRLGRGRWLGPAAAGGLVLTGACLLLDRVLGGLLYARYLGRVPVAHLLIPTTWMPARLLGIGLDQEFGLLPYAPVYALAALGLVPALRREPAVLPLGLAAMAYLYPFLHSPDWYGGFSLPFRYYLALTPLLVLLVAHGVAVVGRGLAARLVGAAGLLSLGLALVLTAVPALRYNPASGRARWLELLGRAVGADVARLVPSAVNPYPETLTVTLLALALLLLAVAVGHRAGRRPAIEPAGPAGRTLPGAALVLVAGLVALVLTARVLPTRQVQGEHMEPRGPGVFFPGHDALPFTAWVLRGPGDLTAAVTLGGGPTRLTVYAGGFSTDGERPRLEVRLDGSHVGEVDVVAGAGTWATGAYAFTLMASPGRHRLTFTLANGLDDRATGRVRHLLIDRVRLARL